MTDKIPIITLKDYNNINKTGLYTMGSKVSYKMFQILTNLESNEQTVYEQKSKKNRDFYFGYQITQDEKSDQEDRGQYTIVINKVRKLVKSLVGILTANKPQYSSMPTHNDDKDTHVSKMTNMILDWIWNNSKGSQTHRKVITRATVDNIGYYLVYYSDDDKVKFKALSFDDVRVQMNSRDSLFDDASVIDYHKWIPIDQVKSLYGFKNGQSLLTDAPTEWNDYINDFGKLPDTQKVYSTDKNYVHVHELRRKVYIRDDNGNLTCRIIKDSIIGIGHLYRHVEPEEITNYDIIPVFSDDTENPRKLGEVEFLRGLQRFYNKAYGVIIHNAQLMSNPKVFVYENSIPDGDIDSFEDKFAQPGSVNLIARTGMNSQDAPIVVGGQPINTAFYTLKQDIDREFEEATLPKQLVGMGDTANKHRNIQRLDMLEKVLDSYKVYTGNIDESLSRLGVVCLQYFKAYINDERVLDITNSRNRIERLRLNQERKLDINNERSIAEFKQAQAQKGMHPIDIEDLIKEAKEDKANLEALTYILNSTKDLSTDIRVVPKSYAPSHELQKLVLMMELKQLGVVDNEAVIENIPYEDRKRLLKRLSQVQQLKNENMNLQSTIEDLEKTINRFKSLFTKQEIEMLKREAKLKQDYIEKDMRVKAYIQKVFTKMRTNQILNETELKAKEMILELQKQIEQESNNAKNEKSVNLKDFT